LEDLAEVGGGEGNDRGEGLAVEGFGDLVTGSVGAVWAIVGGDGSGVLDPGGDRLTAEVAGVGEVGDGGEWGHKVTSREGVAGEGRGAEGVRAAGCDDEAVNGHLGQVEEARRDGLAALGAGVVSAGGVGSGREGGGHVESDGVG
jgi:hypothetical protein